MKVIVAIVAMVFAFGCSEKKKTNVQVKKVNVSSGLKGEKASKPVTKVAKARGAMPNDSVHRGLKAHGGMGMGGMMGHVKIESDNGNPPLKMAGMGSAQELNTEMAKVKDLDAKDKETIEKAFRISFTIERSKRDMKQAKTLFTMVLKKHPGNALAHRGLAYVAILDGFQVPLAISEYKLAIKGDPTYKEAYYGIASLYLTSNPKEGYPFFKKAMELGAADEHGLKRMYDQAMKGAAQ